MLLIVTTWLRQQSMSQSTSKGLGSDTGTLGTVPGEWPTLNTAGESFLIGSGFWNVKQPLRFALRFEASSEILHVFLSTPDDRKLQRSCINSRCKDGGWDMGWGDKQGQPDSEPLGLRRHVEQRKGTGQSWSQAVFWIYSNFSFGKLKAGVSSYCVTDVLFNTPPISHKSNIVTEYAAPLDSDLRVRTPATGGPLQRKLLMSGSASLESSPVMRHATHFMTPPPNHRFLGRLQQIFG